MVLELSFFGKDMMGRYGLLMTLAGDEIGTERWMEMVKKYSGSVFVLVLFRFGLCWADVS